MDPKTNITLPRGYILSGKLMLSAVIVLFSLVLLLLFLHLFLRFLRRRRRNSLTLTASGDRAPAPRGLDPAVLSSLSISLFSVADLDADDVGECAVCLSEFEEGEKVRVLPRCEHRFHVACVDVWFGSNSSCPLCRSPVDIESPVASEDEEEEMASPAEQCGDLEVGSSSSVEIGRREEELGLGLGFGFALVLVMKKLWFGDLRREADLERGEAAE